MTSIELCRKRIINNLLKVSKIDDNNFDVYNRVVNNSHQKEQIKEYLESKTNYELVELVDDGLYFEDYDTKIGADNEKMLIDMIWLEQQISAIDVKKEIANIKDNMQNTADVINLFTDIDKNRTNLEDKVNKLESKIDKLENNISQILELLQKS